MNTQPTPLESSLGVFFALRKGNSMQILQDATSIETALATQAELARLITIHVEVLSEEQ